METESKLDAALDIIALTCIAIAATHGVIVLGKLGVDWTREGIKYLKTKKTANV